MKAYMCLNCKKVLFSSSDLKTLVYADCDFCGGKMIEISDEIKLGQILVKLGYLDNKQLRKALESRDFEIRKPIGQILIKMSFINETQLSEALLLQKEMVKYNH